jgi:hypothetical protein
VRVLLDEQLPADLAALLLDHTVALVTMDRGIEFQQNLSGIDAGAFEVRTSGRRLLLPFAKVDPRPTADNPVVRAFIDKEIGSESTRRTTASPSISSCCSCKLLRLPRIQ